MSDPNEDTWDCVDLYLDETLKCGDIYLDSCLEANAEAGLPSIDVSPLQGKFLSLLAQIQGARRILEIGTLGGYSTIWLARALPPGGNLVTLELNPAHAKVALSNIARAGLADRVQLIEGPAIESLARLQAENQAPFDFIFIDADKPGYPDYLTASLKLSRPGTVIAGDNVVRKGAVADPESTDQNVRGVQSFIELAGADPRLNVTVLQTVGKKGYDGLLIARVI
jgi:predicted O-methyltransferase YrrM